MVEITEAVPYDCPVGIEVDLVAELTVERRYQRVGDTAKVILRPFPGLTWAAEAMAIASRYAADRGLLEDVRSLLPDTTDDL